MYQPTLNFSAQGGVLKATGIRLVASNTPEDYKESFCRFVLTMPSGRLFTSDEVVAAVGMPPHPNAVGGLTSGMADAEAIEYVRHVPTTRPSAHGRQISQWRRI